jgi:rhamnosyltransferase
MFVLSRRGLCPEPALAQRNGARTSLRAGGTRDWRIRNIDVKYLTRMPSVALIVRCFNEEAHIGRLLSGVARQTVSPDKTILVDSGSTDATLSIASAFGVQVETIPPEEFSFGRALNLGIEAAAGSDLCVFASAHVYPVYDTWLERLLKPFDDHRVAVSYGHQQIPLGGRFSEGMLMSQWFPRASTRSQHHPFCNNANAAIRREVWKGLPYDETLTGLEDLAWAKQAMAQGHHIAYVAEAPIVHVHDESIRQVVNRYRREAVAHKQIYPEQHVSLADAVRLASINILSDMKAAGADRDLSQHLIDIVGFRIAQFYGTYRGFAQSGPVTDILRRRFYYPTPPGDGRVAIDDSVVGHKIDYDEPGLLA